jgi:hypothetical protein
MPPSKSANGASGFNWRASSVATAAGSPFNISISISVFEAFTEDDG